MKKLVETLRQENENLKSDSKSKNIRSENVILKKEIVSFKKENKIIYSQLKVEKKNCNSK